MGKIVEKLQAENFENKVLEFIKDVDLVYSRVDRKYMTNQKVNYSAYTAAELIDRLEIRDEKEKVLFKKLIQKHATKTDVGLPKMGITGDLA
jgi:hypothetical protein